MKQGTLNYTEYSCPCKGRINMRKHSAYTKGLFRVRKIFEYYYECTDCDIRSELYQCDVTERENNKTGG